jgi:cytochrome c-type biogenesis protein CcmH/NrfF
MSVLHVVVRTAVAVALEAMDRLWQLRLQQTSAAKAMARKIACLRCQAL